jgi:hypothetical protein
MTDLRITEAEQPTALTAIEAIPALELFERLDAKSEKALVAAAMFAPGALNLIIGRIEEVAREQASTLEISTKKSRAALASLAAKIASSKTYIDSTGKDLGEDLRKRLKAINDERGPAWDRLEALQKEVRKPLTDWENVEKERVAAHEAALAEIQNAGVFTAKNWQSLTCEAIADRIKEIETDTRDWQEFSQRAAGVKAVALNSMKQNLAAAQRMDAEYAETERLRAEAQERAIKEREEAAAKAATEAAEKRAREAAAAVERAAEAERTRLENERAEAEARVKQAEARAKQEAEYAEQKRVAAEKEAKRQLDLAVEKAERDRVAAIEAERRRIAAEAYLERVAAEKREANKRHRAKIGREIEKALVKAGLTPIDAGVVLAALTDGLIPHVSINY